ncbi:hypothetical protein UFOVP240_227 [uncultured Caudovirales phage]|uniref:Uncharacterized protein n=1 Tax=uncultured Caudovirales phage TaxID=2100421 RepID=A0A6J7WU71_9CAUD|nr:hypothetical protein UFOVP240_227 [uncultured Caudovirales phage]
MTTTSKIAEYQELLGVKMRLDKFFSMFLDQYGDQMDSDNTDTPVWKLYKAKLKEYDTVSRSIKEAEYWMKKAELKQADLDKVAATKAEAEAVTAEKKAKEDAIAAGTFETEPAKTARLAAEEEALKATIEETNEFHEIYNPKPEDKPLD